MIIYNNNHHQKHKTVKHTNRTVSVLRSAKVKTSSSKRKLSTKGKSLQKTNRQFLKSLGLVVRQRQKK